MSEFIYEAHRRNVTRMALAYGVASWVFIEIVLLASATLATPAWLLWGLVAMLALGLIPTLSFAWTHELTPDGFKSSAEVSPEDSIVVATAHKMDVTVGVMLVISFMMSFLRWTLPPM